MAPMTTIPHIHWKITHSPPTPPPPWKKNKEKKIDVKYKFDPHPFPKAPVADTVSYSS